MTDKQPDNNLITIKEASVLLGKNVETLRRWDRNGTLTAIKAGVGGHRKYRKEDIEKFLAAKKIKTPVLSDSSETLKDNLSFLNSKQKNIQDYLKTRDQQAADAYIGALRVLKDSSNPDRIYQAAHSLRELTNLLSRNGVGEDREEENKVNFEILSKEYEAKALTDEGFNELKKIINIFHAEERNLKKIEEFFKKEGIPPDLVRSAAIHWNHTHKWFVEACHHGHQNITEDQLTPNLNLLENHLVSLLGDYYGAIDEIDALISKKEPLKSDLDKIKSLIKRPSHYEYFFKHLNNSSWLKLLANNVSGIFHFIDPPALIHENDGTRYPIWIEMQLLTRMVESKPKEVAEIINKTRPTENPWVHDDFMEAIIKMPIEISATLINKINKEAWFKGPFSSRVTEKGGNLVVRCLNGGLIDAAFSLARMLFSFSKVEMDNGLFQTLGGGKSQKRYKVESNIGEWEYQELIKKVAPALYMADSQRTTDLFCKILEGTIKVERGVDDYKDDGSLYLIRPAIEINDVNWSEDIKNSLITAIRDSLEFLGKNNPDKLKESLKGLNHPKGTYPIMLRIQLHIYRQFPNLFQSEIKNIFSNKSYYFDGAIDHEYNLLLKDAFPVLSDEIKNLILGLIDKGPSGRKNLDLKKWQAIKLTTIKNHLEGKWKNYYQTITANYYPDDTEYGSSTKSWVGPTSPLTDQELAEKDASEVIKYLTDWTPEKGPMKPSPNGLGRSLEKVVVDKLELYSKNPVDFFNSKVRPVYIYSLLTGFKDAFNSGKNLDWEKILTLCNLVTESNHPYDFSKDDGGFYQTGWEGVRKAVADLFEEILKSKPNQLPFEYREKVWEILSRLTEDKDPDLEYEKEYGGKNMNPTELSINTTRGDAFHALIQYALWCSRYIYPDEKKKVLVPEVRRTLNKHLAGDKTQTTRSIYGQYFPFLYLLDKKWANKNMVKIFEPFKESLSQSAWNGYVGYANYWVPVVKELRPIYELATENLDPDQKHDNFSDRLSEHLMIGYWRGDINLNDKIIINFHKNASERMKSHAVWFLWRSLEDAKPQKNSPEWARLKEYWKKRVSQKNPRQTSDELARFSDWLSATPENIKEMYQLIIKIIPHVGKGVDVGHLVDYFKLNVDEYPVLVSDVLFRLSSTKPEEFLYRLHDGDISFILQTIVNSGSEKAINLAMKTIDVFGQNGNDNFRVIRDQVRTERVQRAEVNY